MNTPITDAWNDVVRSLTVTRDDFQELASIIRASHPDWDMALCAALAVDCYQWTKILRERKIQK